PPAPGGPDARRRAGGVAAPRGDAAGDVGIAGRPAPRPADVPQPRRRPRRDADPAAGGPEQHGPAGPRGAGAAALRGADQQRDRRGARPPEGGGQQPLRPRPEAPQGDPQQYAGFFRDLTATRSGRDSRSQREYNAPVPLQHPEVRDPYERGHPGP